MLVPHRRNDLTRYATPGGLIAMGKRVYNRYGQYALPMASVAGGYLVKKTLDPPVAKVMPVSKKGLKIVKKQAKQKIAKAKKAGKAKQYCGSRIVKLENKIKDLSKEVDNATGTMTYRQMGSGSLLSSVNQQNAVFYAVNDITTIEQALSQLKYYDPSNPGTLVVGNFATGTFQRNIDIKKSYLELKIKNNYQSDVYYKIYKCFVKDDTNITPVEAWTNGIADSATNASAYTDFNQFITDYDQALDLWKFDIASKGMLKPGGVKIAMISSTNTEYSPSTVDSHGSTYQKEYKAMGFLLVIHGEVAHDSAVSAEQGIEACGVDLIVKRNYVIQYNAGANIRYAYLSTTLDTPTNGLLASHQPLVDNQAYSVS